MPFPAALFRRVLIAGLCTVATGLGLPSRVDAHEIRETASANDRSGSRILVMSCPLMVESDFVDSWGDARSGGRRHEGVDMPAPRGSAVVAVRSGFAEFKVSNAGGNAIWLTTSDGDKFYYAHLDGWEGTSRDVRRGEVIGYVGSTGNARGNHLHLETHLGGTPTNPFPIVAGACTDTRDDRTPRGLQLR
jgi:murein DD-endopeptidase MepM/ murein hydrolase activator NlpD